MMDVHAAAAYTCVLQPFQSNTTAEVKGHRTVWFSGAEFMWAGEQVTAATQTVVKQLSRQAERQ